MFEKDYDYILYTDGSGSTSDLPVGFGSYSISKNGEIHKMFGFCSNGTVNSAELLGLVNFLSYLDSINKIPSKILLISDSELTVKCGKKEYARNFNLGYWSFIDYYIENRKCFIDFKWEKRSSSIENRWCDKTSKDVRLLAKGLTNAPDNL